MKRTYKQILKDSHTLRVINRDDYFAARAFGLTAYGDTEEEAVAKLKRMFAFWVDASYKKLLEVTG